MTRGLPSPARKMSRSDKGSAVSGEEGVTAGDGGIVNKGILRYAQNDISCINLFYKNLKAGLFPAFCFAIINFPSIYHKL